MITAPVLALPGCGKLFLLITLPVQMNMNHAFFQRPGC